MRCIDLFANTQFWPKDYSKSKRKDLQDSRETCFDVWFGDGCTDKKIGGARAEDVKVFNGSDLDGHEEIGKIGTVPY